MESGLVPDAESGGPHTSRTIMLRELEILLSDCQPDAGSAEYSDAVVGRNVLGKRSFDTRLRSLRYLKELYGLDRELLLFRALRDLWDADAAVRPLLALLVAMARDPLLRATASSVLDAPSGASVDASTLAAAVKDRFPDSYGDAVRAKVGRNAASSWTQSGHLVGRVRKIRAQAVCGPAAVTMALFIGHLAGDRGVGLLRTPWGRALDAPEELILHQAFAASQRGWLELRHVGDVVDVGCRWLLRAGEAI